MKNRIRVSSYKITAKQIINENFWKCLLASMLIICPRIALVALYVAAGLLRNAEIITVLQTGLTVLIGTLVFLCTNSALTAGGELILARAVDNHYNILSRENARKTVPKTIKEFGFFNLLKLRTTIVASKLKDALLSMLPAAIILGVTWLFVSSTRMPTAAFFITVTGLTLIVWITSKKIILEFDKYAFVFSALNADYSVNTSKKMLESSNRICSCNIDFVKRIEESLLGWRIAAALTFPIVFPVVYFVMYRRVAMYIIPFLSTPNITERECTEMDTTLEMSPINTTVVFEIQ